jgi:hypothetical protein
LSACSCPDISTICKSSLLIELGGKHSDSEYVLHSSEAKTIALIHVDQRDDRKRKAWSILTVEWKSR